MLTEELLALCTRTFKGHFDSLQQLPSDEKGQSIEETKGPSAAEVDCAATDDEREGVSMSVQSTSETDAAGQRWFTTGKPLEQCRRAMAACEDSVLIVCDVSKHLGAKKFGSICNPSALQEYVTRRRTMGLGHANLYEGLTEELPTKLYADIDLQTASKVEGDFERYKKHIDKVRDAFLVDVLGIQPESIRFEASKAHGDAADGGYKWSIHELLRG
jgi:hypothetical protein